MIPFYYISDTIQSLSRQLVQELPPKGHTITGNNIMILGLSSQAVTLAHLQCYGLWVRFPGLQDQKPA